MDDINEHSFNFLNIIQRYDKIDTYVLSSTLEKYKSALVALVDLLQNIQIRYAGTLENTSYAEFSRVLLKQFDK